MRLALLLPVVDGTKTTPSVQVAPGASEPEHVVVRAEKLAVATPEIWKPIFAAAPPVLVIVTT